MATKATGVVVSNVELTVNESKFRKQGVSLFEEADQIIVRSPEDMRKAIEFGRGIADLIMNITAFFGPLKKTAKAAHTALCDKEKEALDIPRQAESVVDAAIRKYRQAEAAKAQAAADKERARLQAQAEKERAAEAALSAGIEIEPVDTAEADEEAKKFGTSQVDYIYEQPSEELFAGLIPQYVSSMLYHAMTESVAAEHAARMTAMDSATNNASDMIDALTLHMNRVRQAAITKEIIEIVSGAAAQ